MVANSEQTKISVPKSKLHAQTTKIHLWTSFWDHADKLTVKKSEIFFV